MSEEIKKLIQAQGDAHAEFKKTMEASIADLKKNGSESQVEMTAKMTEILADYDALKDKMDTIAADMQIAKYQGAHEDPKLKAHKEAFHAYCRKNDPSKFQNSLSVGVDPDGGYTCPADVSTRIVEVIQKKNPLRQLATVETTTKASWDMRTDPNDMTASRIGEQGTRADTSTPQIGLIEIPIREMYVYPKATQQVLDDSDWDFESWLVKKAGRAFANLERTEMAAGDGVLGARGITAYDKIADASWSWGKTGFITTGSASAISATGAELVNLAGALEDEYKASAAWIMNRATLTSYRLLRVGTSAANMFLLWQPSLVAGVQDTLNGYPVYTSAGMPVQASNAYIAAFGDFSEAYTIVDRKGINIIRDNITSPGFVKFHIYRRSTGGVTNYEAIKLLKCAS